MSDVEREILKEKCDYLYKKIWDRLTDNQLELFALSLSFVYLDPEQLEKE